MPQRNVINRGARGFLQLFNAKQNGQGPKDLRVDVQPVVDVETYISPDLLRGATDVETGNPPSNPSILIPDDENWLVYSVGITAYTSTPASADWAAVHELRIGGLVDNDGSSVTIRLDADMMSPNVTPAEAGVGINWTPPKPMLFPGSLSFQCIIPREDSPDNWTATISVLYALLKT